MTCRIGAEGDRVLHHRYRGSPPTMPALMETRAPPPPGSPSGPMIPGTGEEIEKREVVKGYEYSRERFPVLIGAAFTGCSMPATAGTTWQSLSPRQTWSESC
jgi:hypothetical protein